MTSKVLLVEDDPLSLKLMRDAILAQGYEVDAATDGHTALCNVAAQAPDLVVLDIGLPGIDGTEVIRRLKADRVTAGIPVVAVTAFAMPEDERRVRAAGCDAFLTKPLRLKELVAVVDALIAARIRQA